MSGSRFSSPVRFFEETISSVSDSPVPSSIQHEDTFSFSDSRLSSQNQFEDTFSTLSTDAYDEPPPVVVPDGTLTSGETSAADLSVGSDACMRPIPILKPGPEAEGQPSGTTTAATGLPSQPVEDTDSTNSHTMDMSLVSDSSFPPVPSAAPGSRAASPSTSPTHSGRRHTSHSARSSISEDSVYRDVPFLRVKKSSSSVSSSRSADSVNTQTLLPKFVLLEEKVDQLTKERDERAFAARELSNVVRSLKADYDKQLASQQEKCAIYERLLTSSKEEYDNLKKSYDALMDKYISLLS